MNVSSLVRAISSDYRKYTSSAPAWDTSTMSLPFRSSNVAVFGLGYVGCVTAACLARLGHRVTGIDKDLSKVGAVMEKRAPFYEPGLDQIIEETVVAGLLRATSEAEEALGDADVVLLCVGTPSAANGNLGLDQLRNVTEEVAAVLPRLSKPLVVAVRSTVFPGSCEEVVIPRLARFGLVSVVSNPEFLREGAAVQDFVEPALVVVGGSDREAVEKVASLYASLKVDPCLVTLRTAEMIKYACNAFHAVKISFANEIGSLGEVLGIDAREVMETLCQDHRLNISKAYLKPGFAFGGSCLPKDLRALNYRAGRLDLKLPMLSAVLPSNDEHLRRATTAVLNLPARRIGVVGLAFKENTDDLRESPVVTLLENLIGKGRDLRVWDPHIRVDSIYGSNRNFLMNAIPHIGRLMEPTLEDLVGWADYLVITQSPGAKVSALIAQSGLPALDLIGGIAGRVPVSSIS
jgi:GDP-mannose 6-dehydrogenase